MAGKYDLGALPPEFDKPLEAGDVTEPFSIKPISSESLDRMPCLVITAGPGVGQIIRLKATVTIGRSDQATVRVPAPSVSRVHCRVLTTEAGVFVEDTGSTNGTSVNGIKIPNSARKQLERGDIIYVGDIVRLRFVYLDSIDQHFHENLIGAAMTDGLTGAANRRAFDERLKEELYFSGRYQSPLSVIMLDIDHFKRINDQYGHIAGDRALVTVVRVIGPTLRSSDMLARFGGEEFVIMARGVNAKGAARLAERLLVLVAKTTIEHEADRFCVTLSGGVADSSTPGIEAPRDLVSAADQALYAAKHNGRNRVEVFCGAFQKNRET
jgi:diguanylate cyclase (GGDEF)-like protein